MFTRGWTVGTVGSAGQVMSLANLRLHAIKIYVTNGMVAGRIARIVCFGLGPKIE